MPFNIGPGELAIALVIAGITLSPILLVVWILRSAGVGRPVDAVGILDERLARGEITVEQYHEARRALGR